MKNTVYVKLNQITELTHKGIFLRGAPCCLRKWACIF